MHQVLDMFCNFCVVTNHKNGNDSTNTETHDEIFQLNFLEKHSFGIHRISFIYG